MDAIEHRRLIERTSNEIDRLVECGFLENGIHWIRAWADFDLKWSGEEEKHLTIRASCVDSFIGRAVNNAEVFRLALFFVGTRLKQGVNVPRPLLDLAADYLTGDRKAPAGKPGRSKKWGRDFIIISVMRQLLDEHDIFATHNRHPKGVRKRKMSASEIVGEALPRSRAHYVDPEQINKIWHRYVEQTEGAGNGRAESGFSDHQEVQRLYHNMILDDEDELVRL